MALNPVQILRLKNTLNAFRNRHPGFSRFIGALRAKGVPEGSILDMKVTSPDGKSMETNFRVTPEDIELIRMLAELRG